MWRGRGARVSVTAQMNVAVGLKGEVRLVVGEADTANALGSGDVHVLGTPRLVALFEQATVDALRGILDEGQTSVGMRVQIDHLQPTPGRCGGRRRGPRRQDRGTSHLVHGDRHRFRWPRRRRQGDPRGRRRRQVPLQVLQGRLTTLALVATALDRRRLRRRRRERRNPRERHRSRHRPAIERGRHRRHRLPAGSRRPPCARRSMSYTTAARANRPANEVVAGRGRDSSGASRPCGTWSTAVLDRRRTPGVTRSAGRRTRPTDIVTSGPDAAHARRRSTAGSPPPNRSPSFGGEDVRVARSPQIFSPPARRYVAQTGQAIRATSTCWSTAGFCPRPPRAVGVRRRRSRPGRGQPLPRTWPTEADPAGIRMRSLEARRAVRPMTTSVSISCERAGGHDHHRERMPRGRRVRARQLTDDSGGADDHRRWVDHDGRSSRLRHRPTTSTTLDGRPRPPSPTSWMAPVDDIRRQSGRRPDRAPFGTCRRAPKRRSSCWSRSTATRLEHGAHGQRTSPTFEAALGGPLERWTWSSAARPIPPRDRVRVVRRQGSTRRPRTPTSALTASTRLHDRDRARSVSER